jgi:hypothetical protein
MFIAGGSCEALFTLALNKIYGANVSVSPGDVDFYFMDSPKYPPYQEALRFVERLHASGGRRSAYALSLTNPQIDKHVIRKTREMFADIKRGMMSSGGNFPIQIILSKTPDMASVIQSYDMEACQIALFDGKFYTTEAGLYGLLWGINTVKIEKIDRVLCARLKKYASRGYDINLPNDISPDFVGIDPVLLAAKNGFGSLLIGEVHQNCTSGYAPTSNQRMAFQAADIKLPEIQKEITGLLSDSWMPYICGTAYGDLKLLEKTGKIAVFDFTNLQITDDVCRMLLDGTYPYKFLLKEAYAKANKYAETFNKSLEEFSAARVTREEVEKKANMVVKKFLPLSTVQLTPPFTATSAETTAAIGFMLDVEERARWSCPLDSTLPRPTKEVALKTISELTQGYLRDHLNLKAIGKAASAYYVGKDPLEQLRKSLESKTNCIELSAKLFPSVARIVGIDVSTYAKTVDLVGDVKQYVETMAANAPAAEPKLPHNRKGVSPLLAMSAPSAASSGKNDNADSPTSGKDTEDVIQMIKTLLASNGDGTAKSAEFEAKLRDLLNKKHE